MKYNTEVPLHTRLPVVNFQRCKRVLAPVHQLLYCACVISQLCQTLYNPWTVAHLAPLSTGLARQEHCSGLPCPPPGDLPDPGVKPQSLGPPTLAGELLYHCASREALLNCSVFFKVPFYKIKNIFIFVCFLHIIYVKSIINLL